MDTQKNQQGRDPGIGHDGHVTEVMSVDNLFTGIVSVCALRGIRTLTLRGNDFFDAMEAAYTAVLPEAERRGVDLDFAIFLDPVYGDSPLVQEAVHMGVTRRLVSLDNPEYQEMRIKFGHAEAELLLRRLPGGRQLYEGAASAFLDHQLVLT